MQKYYLNTDNYLTNYKSINTKYILIKLVENKF